MAPRQTASKSDHPIPVRLAELDFIIIEQPAEPLSSRAKTLAWLLYPHWAKSRSDLKTQDPPIPKTCPFGNRNLWEQTLGRNLDLL